MWNFDSDDDQIGQDFVLENNHESNNEEITSEYDDNDKNDIKYSINIFNVIKLLGRRT